MSLLGYLLQLFVLSTLVFMTAARIRCSRYCNCNGQRVNCESHGRHLTYIPRLPEQTTILIFSNNYLPVLSREKFVNISRLNLTQLTLKVNHIQEIQPGAFDSFSKLRTLDLTGNNLLNKTALTNTFQSLQNTSLDKLFLDDMRLTNADLQAFSGVRKLTVSTIYLRRNNLTQFKPESFQDLPKLKGLLLSNNHLEDYKFGNGLPHLEKLNLDFNEYGPLFPNFCKNGTAVFPKLKTLNLNRNLIKTLESTHLSCLNALQQLAVDENVIEMLKNNIFSSLPALKDLSLQNMKPRLGYFEPLAFNSSSLQKLNLAGNNIPFYDRKVNKTSFFKYSPNIKHLNLDNNDLHDKYYFDLKSLLSPLKNLNWLSMQSCHIRQLTGGLFQCMPHLQTLQLGGNDIHSWTKDPTVFENVTSVKKLILESNNINIITNVSFPITLQKSLKKLNLANNPFTCDCDNLWFRNWIERNVKDKSNGIQLESYPQRYKCATPESMHEKLLIKFRPTEESCRALDPVVIVLSSLAIFTLVLIVTSGLCYRGRWYIRYAWYKIRHRRKYSGEQQLLLSDEIEYDAYVMYSDPDGKWVRNELIAILEGECKAYKLCVQDRDFMPGTAKVDNICDSIYKSRKIIVVMSNSFLKDAWCQFQLDVAVDRKVQLGKEIIFVVLLQNLDGAGLKKSICVFLSKADSASWVQENPGKALFLEKLTRSMKDQEA